jgi:formamidopyrimidine-DNA glycosylase
MSVELPEAKILAEQMNSSLLGKRIKSYSLMDSHRLQKIGFMNKDTKEYDNLVGSKIESVISSGNTIKVSFDKGWNLLITPEYGGRVFFKNKNEQPIQKYHFKANFTDGSFLTIRLTSMGVIKAVEKRNLKDSYIYQRDFSETPSPIDDELTYERFSKNIVAENRMLKGLLVGKNAVVIGLSNSAFQDIVYRAKLHPKRKGSSLSEAERTSLYNAIKLVVNERLRLGGKDQFLDLYGKRGGYTPAMGSHMKNMNCPRCGNGIEGLQIAGGVTYICSSCQK